MNRIFKDMVRIPVCLFSGVLVLAVSGCVAPVYEPLPPIPEYPVNQRKYDTSCTIKYLSCGNPELDRALREMFNSKQYHDMPDGNYYKDVLPRFLHIFRVLDLTTTLYARPEGSYLHTRIIVMIRPPGVLAGSELKYGKARYFQAHSRRFIGKEKVTAFDYREGMLAAVEHLFRIHEFRSALERKKVRKDVPAGEVKDRDSLWRMSLYYQKRGPEGKVEAVRWAYHAAAAGHPQAQGYIATEAMHTKMFGDNKQLFKLVHSLASGGFPQAQYKLGMMYSSGSGVIQNQAEAVRWYALSAKQGFPPALYALGVCYATGAGLPQDVNAAIKLLREAKRRGHAPAGEYLETLESQSEESGK